MKIQVDKKIGDAVAKFEIDERDAKDAFVMLSFLTEPDHCYLQGFENAKIKWQARRAKNEKGEFTYIERKAFSSDGRIATSTMGEYQKGGYYWKKWEIYQPKENLEQIEHEGY